ncbi:GNAT family N-acetyltransferase [Kitasatospora purpeofusca]|uniref:GNAT family N-acetyltransferase n=1 Tax=Kitasatospora purpeofusca TaxID=67352 RepID=UPI002254641E|nr:GNAT family N-acetyltransferase [Kitasatospora purpeofusca]MCX4689755.1 GNAT family N-acetyltransferase [Kitasatospora purpeofusca]
MILRNVHGQSAGPGGDISIRRFTDADSAEELTLLLHRAYAAHAAAGTVFFASYQSVQDTEVRAGRGECWLAFQGAELVGSVTVAAPYAVPAGYPAPADAGSFWQLAVDPTCQGAGLGQRLLTVAEDRIVALGAAKAVIDTSVEAVDLVGWYLRRGYAPIGTWRWDVTNYESVVLLKDLAAARLER